MSKVNIDELYEKLLEVLGDTIAFIKDLPAKKLVDEWLEPKLKELGSDIELDLYKIGEGIPVKGTMEKINKIKKFLKEAKEFLEENYLPTVESGRQDIYYDWELKIMKDAQSNIKSLSKALEMFKRSIRK